jgi:anti-sigma-K factor RskA
MSEEDMPDLAAAEHALGVLSGAERAEAEARMARDPAFAAEVEAWRERLAPMSAEIADVAPPPGLWSSIEQRLPANDNALRFWRRTALGSMSVAAASLVAAVFLASNPIEVTRPTPGQMLNAQLVSDGAQPLFIAAYYPERQMMTVTSLVPPGSDPAHVHQLWLIPADGKPHSLGMVEPGKTLAMPMPQEMMPMVTAGAQLAVSVEAPGGSKREGPTGPVAAIGKLSEI